MWCRFEESKNNIQAAYASLITACKKEGTLTEATLALAEQYDAGEERKAACICHVLQQAELAMVPGDLFALHIAHQDALRKCYWHWKGQQPFDAIGERFGNGNAFLAVTDMGHIAPDWPYVLRRGISGILEDLEQCSAAHRGDPQKEAYYGNRKKVYESIRALFLRFADTAEAANPLTAETLRHLVANPPETLLQAMQLILLFYMLQTDLDIHRVRTLGNLDRMLYPFYQQDLERGRYTRQQLEEITKYFLWDISCLQVDANLPFAICGTDEAGRDCTNDFTFFLLDCYRQLDIYDPKIHVMYHDGLHPEALRRILEMIREGKNSFVFINVPIAVQALQRIGIAKADAQRLAVYGCYETAAMGTEIPCTVAGQINFAKAMETVLDGREQFDRFEDFYEAVAAQMLGYTQACMDTLAAYEPDYPQFCPGLILSPTYTSSRESGIDLYAGGAKYNNTSIVGAGLATLVDSLLAVKGAVFEEKRLTLDELRSILQANWQEHEQLRLLMRKKYEKFGNHAAQADDLAADLYHRFAAAINGKKNGRGGVFRCGMFSVDWRFWMGQNTGATPDGRLRGEPISKNLAASQGQDKNGVTAYLQSVLRLDATHCPDGAVADVVLHRSAVQGEAGMQAFLGLLKTFLRKGGFAVHFNVLEPSALIRAQKEPEKYRNLQIRLCGWNVRFVDLDKAQQDAFICQASRSPSF